MEKDVINWQPMADAPKRVVSILLKLKSGQVTMGHWSGEINPFRPWVYINRYGGLNPHMPMIMGRCSDTELVGWMELPE